MIRVSMEVKQMIEEEKIIPREPLNDCIKRGILENRKHRQHPSIETRDVLKSEIENVVTNKEIVKVENGIEDYRTVWDAHNPEDKLIQEFGIHHINGNHNDNRIENLAKVSLQQHGNAHAQLHKEFPMLNSTKSNDIIGKTI